MNKKTIRIKKEKIAGEWHKRKKKRIGVLMDGSKL